ncbi:hypothetical protein [Mycolicibacterium austroafricanum]|uniref:hypothetical protein n=1 Tax=Mycolicibacterium austroafricanum TaxID=39687 RepID=UPI001F3A09F6|nr:hypothetical protein [Mycolicibacterium austroafricanum]
MTTTRGIGRHRLSRRPAHLGHRLTTVSMMAVAGVAGWLWTSAVAQPEPTSAPQQPAPAAQAHHEIQRVGQVIAASRDSLTTSTPDGQTTTFRITADTTQIGPPGTVGPYTSFPLKRNVVVLGIVHEGVPVATAIADQAAVGPDGPPMDYGLPT